MKSFAVAGMRRLGGDADPARQHDGAVIVEGQTQQAAAVVDLRDRRGRR